MQNSNKAILEAANLAVSNGDNEGFLDYCTDDIKWTFIGDRTIEGKQKVLAYMKETYLKPPKFKVKNLIAENDFVTAVGTISLKDKMVMPRPMITVMYGSFATEKCLNSPHLLLKDT